MTSCTTCLFFQDSRKAQLFLRELSSVDGAAAYVHATAVFAKVVKSLVPFLAEVAKGSFGVGCWKRWQNMRHQMRLRWHRGRSTEMDCKIIVYRVKVIECWLFIVNLVIFSPVVAGVKSPWPV